MEALLSNGNPYAEHSGDLDGGSRRLAHLLSNVATMVTLDSKCASLQLVPYLSIKSMGQEQYSNFRLIVLDSIESPFTAPIKGNNLLLFYEKTKKSQQLC